jgi:NADPH:quinone reductase
LTGDVVGTIEKVGPDADPALAGTRVAVLLEDAYADYVVADASWLVGVPASLGADTASMLPTAGAVALGTLRTGRLSQGDTVLVTAGAGAIGHLAVQLARQQGAGTVIAAAGSPAKLDFLKELSADVAIDYTQPDWSEQVRLAAPGGVDVILEAVGGQILHQSIALLAPFGRAVVYGAAAGDLPGWRAPQPRQVAHPGSAPVPRKSQLGGSQRQSSTSGSSRRVITTSCVAYPTRMTICG